MYSIICEDLNHNNRSSDDGWSETLGTSSVENASGYLCLACINAKNNDIALVKSGIISAAKDAINSMISSAFPQPVQQSLLSLYTEASITSKQNRKAYIQPAFDWTHDVLQRYAAYRESIDAAQSIEAARSEILDLHTNLDIPDVRVTRAIQIID